MQNDDIEQQLQDFPLDEPVVIDGQSVYLRVDQEGAELGALFLEAATERQLLDAVQLGFQSALEFEAGWALDSDGGNLLLTQWLPGAQDWHDAADALELMLNQIELLRSVVTITSGAAEPGASRDERAIRSKIMGVNR